MQETRRFRLDGRTAVVTGGASGIGAAMCRAFTEQGASVTIADVDVQRGMALVEALGTTAAFERTDVTELASVQTMLGATLRRRPSIDVFVNCAGLGLVGNVQETEDNEWDRLLAVNVTGVFHGCRAAVDQMLTQRPQGGLIINIASVAGLIGVSRRFAYCATKGAVIAMTKELALDYAKEGIRCNAICPGTVFTPFVEGYLERFHAHNKAKTIEELHARQPLGRMGRPEEIADLAVYMASDSAGFMTGSAIVIDGGWTAQ